MIKALIVIGAVLVAGGWVAWSIRLIADMMRGHKRPHVEASMDDSNDYPEDSADE